MAGDERPGSGLRVELRKRRARTDGAASRRNDPSHRRSHLVGAPLGRRSRSVGRLHPLRECTNCRRAAGDVVERHSSPRAPCEGESEEDVECVGGRMSGGSRPSEGAGSRGRQRRAGRCGAVGRVRAVRADGHGFRCGRGAQLGPADWGVRSRCPAEATEDSRREAGSDYRGYRGELRHLVFQLVDL